MKDEIIKLTKDINDIVQDLLVPVRTERKIDEKAFNAFYDYLDQVIKLVKGEPFIPRQLVGLLFLIYTTLAGANTTNDYKDSIFMEVAKLEDYLDQIYWDSPFRR